MGYNTNKPSSYPYTYNDKHGRVHIAAAAAAAAR